MEENETPMVKTKQIAQTYFAGYVAHDFKKKIKCDKCSKMVVACSGEIVKNDELIKERAYMKSLEEQYGKLVPPSNDFISMVNDVVENFDENFKNIAWEKNVKAKINNLCSERFLSTLPMMEMCKDHNFFIINRINLILIRAVLKRQNKNMKSFARNSQKLNIINNK